VNGVQDLFGNAISGAMETFDVSLYAPPNGYYTGAEGLSGEALRGALHVIIDDHTVKSYDFALTAFYTSDDKPNGKVWDMYSDVPGGTPPYEYTFGVDEGSSASGEGQGYNREHSWPRSWFGGEVSPMNSDLFQLYPTDIYVNSIRGSFPYGEVSAPDYTAQNGTKRGPNTYPGYTGTVVEPIDAYKGDFARSYFYMTVRYYTEDGAWPGSDMTDGADLEPWALDMLLEWHQQDPVSEKELERNHVLYGFQGNRNPFIDRPEFAVQIYDPTTAVPDKEPARLHLLANAPNPFRSSTTIHFELEEPAKVTVDVFDLQGRRIRSLFEDTETRGVHRVTWDGTDASRNRVPAGIYFYRVAVKKEAETRKMLLLR
jgi:endonuclease I